MKKNLTAVEWLRYQTLEGTIDKLENVMYLKLPIGVFIKAQEMEIEQIISAHNDGALMAYALPFNAPFKKGEEYYNETYGQI